MAKRSNPLTDALAMQGTPIPGNVLAKMKATLSGRMTLHFFALACGKPDHHPSRRAWAAFERRLARENVNVALAVHHARFAQCWGIKGSALPRVALTSKIVSQLSNAFSKPRMLELEGPAPPFSSSVAVLAVPWNGDDGTRVYTIYAIDERFPDSAVAVAAVRVSSKLEIRVLNPGGWATGRKDDPVARVLLRALVQLANSVPRLQTVSPEESARLAVKGSARLAVNDGTPRATDDPELMTRLRALRVGKEVATLATVRMDHVAVHDPRFALSVREALIDLCVERIRSGEAPALVVYWTGGHYVSGDDYTMYMAYRRMRADFVPVVVIGKLGPVESIEKKGGFELLPQVGILTAPVDDDFAAWNQRLKNDGESLGNTYAELHARYIQLAQLLNDPRTKEGALQRALTAQHSTIDAYGTGLSAEVRLGDKYRIDLVMNFAGSDARQLLIELERASHRLFTRSGRLRAPITHAIQQVQDWFRWCRENPNIVPKQLERTLPFEGLVVAGRSRDLSEDEKQRLIHLNKDAPVKVVTWDDLLMRIDQLLLRM